MLSSHLILCRPLVLLPPIPRSIRVFSNESTLRMGWTKYWSYSFSIIPSNEHPGLISFRMDWVDLLSVQGTLESLLQHHSSKASILRHSAFFLVQLSHPYITTGKTTLLFATPWTVAYQAPLSMGFSRQECWSGLQFPSPGDLPNPEIEPRSPTVRANALPSEPPGKSKSTWTLCSGRELNLGLPHGRREFYH